MRWSCLRTAYGIGSEIQVWDQCTKVLERVNQIVSNSERGDWKFDIWVECWSMVRETWVQSQVESYLRLLKWYFTPPCLTHSNIRYVSGEKWSNPGKGVAPYPTPRCSSYWKGILLVTFIYSRQQQYIYIYIHIY